MISRQCLRWKLPLAVLRLPVWPLCAQKQSVSMFHAVIRPEQIAQVALDFPG